MAAAQSKVQYIVELIDKFSKQADSVAKSAEGMASQAKTIATGFKLVGAAIAASGITRAFISTIEAAQESVQVQNQMLAVLESTGNAAGMTADQLTDLANGLQSTSNYTDEAILSAENVLLTFTKVGSTVFPAATQAITDLSAAMGQDLQSSALQIGKALNDPIEGITALTRAGVTFSDGQKEVIAQLVETGDVAGAQTIILDELAKEFGGSAASQVTPLTAMKKVIDETAETIGMAFLPAVNLAAVYIKDLSTESVGGIGKVMNFFGEFLFDAVRGVAVFVEVTSSFFSQIGVVIAGIAQGLMLATKKVINTIIGWVEDRINTTSKLAKALGFDWLADKMEVNFGRINTEGESFGAIWQEMGDNSQEIGAAMVSDLESIFSASSDTEKALQGGSQTIQDYASTAEEATGAASESFDKLATAASETMGKIDDSLSEVVDNIAAIQEEMDALFLGRAEDLQTEQETLAEAFIAQYELIEELKRDIADETDAYALSLLEDQLATAEEELAKRAHIEELYAAEISQAKDYASQSDFERAFSDFQESASLIEQEFQLEYEKLQERLALEESAARYLLALKAQGEQLAAEITLQGEQLTIESINRTIEAYNALATAISNARSGQTSSTVSTDATAAAMESVSTSFAVPAFAKGGIVNSPTLAMVGEAGPEAIIPLGKASGGIQNIININWSGAVDERSAEMVAKTIVKELQLNLQFSLL